MRKKRHGLNAVYRPMIMYISILGISPVGLQIIKLWFVNGCKWSGESKSNS